MQALPGNVQRFCAMVCVVGAVTGGCAQPAARVARDEAAHRADAHLAWWQAARFGMFIHWGPVSLEGTEIGWSRGGERRGRTGMGTVPAEVYDRLYERFDPVEFDADEWVRIARDAGMRYMVFTTKHHDGFVNFDSKLTDYKITSPKSPFGRDLVKELADACHRAGLPIGFYYSQPDWHHPDYRTERHAAYIAYMHGQLRELCTNYGRVSILWFDGLGGTAEDWDSERMFAMIHELQPGIIINNRAGLPGDYSTPEQTIGAFERDKRWESCITIGTQWSYKSDDRIKSVQECVQTLVRVAGGDGNLLFNVGPMPDGRIEPRQVERLREMGDWLKRYGQTIYGTRGGPLRWNVSGPAPVTTTHKGKTLYVHVLDWEGDFVKLPPIGARVLSSSVLTGGSVNVRQSDEGITIAVDRRHRHGIDTIVALELDRQASTLATVDLYPGTVLEVKTSEASSVFQDQKQFTAPNAFDGRMNTRWAAESGVRAAWMEADLGEQKLVDCVVVCEYEPGRVQRFEIQYKEGDEWKTVHSGTTIGQRLILPLTPVRTRFVRLNVLEATNGPAIAEMQIRTTGAP